MTNNDGVVVASRIQKIVSVVRCDSAEALRAATSVAARLNHPDSEIARSFVTFSGGSETREERVFRIGDYFNRIEFSSNESGDSGSFSLIFHIREGVDAYWKDLLVATMQAIRESAPGVKVCIVPGGAKP